MIYRLNHKLVAAVAILSLQNMVCLASDKFDLRLVYPEELGFSEGSVKFDPVVRKDEHSGKFEIHFSFVFKGSVNSGELKGLHYTFPRSDNGLLETICKIRSLQDGESLERENLIKLKRIGPDLVGVIYRAENASFTPFEFNMAFDSAVKFSERVNQKATWLRLTFDSK